MRIYQENDAKLLERFVDSGVVRLFAFISCVLDEKRRSDDEFFYPIYFFFNILSDRNGVSRDLKLDKRPVWLDGGLPGGDDVFRLRILVLAVLLTNAPNRERTFRVALSVAAMTFGASKKSNLTFK